MAIPQSGPYRLFGTQFLQGLNTSPLAATATFNVVDTVCSRTGGEAAASQITSDIIIGFPCVDALDSAQQSGLLAGKTILVPFSGPVTQAPATDTTNYARVISFGPSTTNETDTLAEYVVNNWRSESIAVIDDGTLYGRQIAQDILAALSNANLPSVYTTTFRPQLENQVGLVRLLQRAGATHIVVGGDRFDADAIAQATQIIDYELTLAGGTAFGEGIAEGSLPAGTAFVTLPDWSEQKAAQDAIMALDEAGIAAEGFAFWGYATGQLAAAWLAADALKKDGISSQSWPTIFGQIQFNVDGTLDTNLYAINQVTIGVDDDTN